MKTNPNDPINEVESLQAVSLTKREYFAALVMQGVLAGHYEFFTGNADVSVPSEIAKYAVFNADALIDELNKD